MRLSVVVRVVSWLVCAVSACTGQESVSPPDAAVSDADGDAGDDLVQSCEFGVKVPRAMPAPGGDGVCCVALSCAQANCSGGPPGGWAPIAAQCTPHISDVYYNGISKDSHGCPVLVPDPHVCCGCPAPDASSPAEGGSDGATDAATAALPDSASDARD